MIGIVLCLYTGMRIGELLSLEWQDIDFMKGIITIINGFLILGGNYGFKNERVRETGAKL